MTALRIGVLLSLVVACFTQGFYGQFPRFGYSAPGTVPYGSGPVPAAGGPFLGYDAVFSGLQRTPIYAGNFAYDQSSARGPNCVNGVRVRDGSCRCRPGFKGADCNVPLPDISLNQEPGVVCQQTPGSLETLRQEEAQIRAGGEETKLEKDLQQVMAHGGQPNPSVRLLGPGFGRAFCPSVPNGGPMAPVHLKSALTDYGYVVCSENQLCYNKVCPSCTMFNPKTGGCDNIPNPNARGLPNCNVRPGEAPYSLKVEFRRATLQRPKLSGEPGRLPPPQGVPNAPTVGSAFVGGAPYARPYYG